MKMLFVEEYVKNDGKATPDCIFAEYLKSKSVQLVGLDIEKATAEVDVDAAEPIS